MSLKISIDKLSDGQKTMLADDLTISQELEKMGKIKKFASPQQPQIELFSVEKDEVIVPFAYGIQKLQIKRPKLECYAKMDKKDFLGVLREEQKSIKDEAIQQLNVRGTTLISCYPGFGKTITSIYISSKIGLKSLILVNRVVLMNQWKEAISKFCPGSVVQLLTPQTNTINKDADFFVINAMNVPKFSALEIVGTIIVDEAHLILSNVLSKSLQKLFPKYLIGLSATPYRTDGFNALFDLYFGEKKIIRKLFHPHIVYKVETGIVPELEYDRNGTVIWGKLIEAQSLNEARNRMILSIVQTNLSRTILILTKRIEQAKWLCQELKKLNEHVDTFIENQVEFDKNCRILIGTTSKVGVGFDHDKLDCLILACDLEEYFIQYLGRVFRRKDSKPIVFDLVDQNPILKRHFATRKAIYNETGGVIQTLKCT